MEEAKRIKVKQRIRELYEARKNEKEKAPRSVPDAQDAAIAANNAAAADALLQGYHRGGEEPSSRKRCIASPD